MKAGIVVDADEVRAVAQAEMERCGLWNPALEPLLDDYVGALARAETHRTAADAAPVSANESTGVQHGHPGFAIADREMRRAVDLADELGLTPKAQLRLKVKKAPAAKQTSVFDRISPQKLRAVG